MRILRKTLIVCLYFLLSWLLVPFSLKAQSISIHHSQLQFLFGDSLLQNASCHSALLPFKTAVTRLNNIFSPKQAAPVEVKNFLVVPVLDARAEYYPSSGEFAYRLGQGAFVAGNMGKKVGFELSAVLYEQKFPGENYSIDSLKLVPRNNRYLWGKNDQAAYPGIRGNIYWKANKWLTFTAGNDKYFIGDGQKSMLLSENAAAYPFFQTRLNIWKVNYMHQVMFMKDLVPGIKDKRFDKYASMHVLSLKATKRINVYVFEAVVWRKQDSIRHRGFDINYLNPFLFFRPVEFNMGSPDNVFMGIGGKIILWKQTFVYGQFMLDEFKLKEVKARNGWWANKYALQAGFKSYGLLKNHRSLFTAEYNHIRPFTYAHTNSLQNYGYLNQSLAHPQGSNFKEFVITFRVQYHNTWLISLKGQYLNYGTDPEGTNLGSDIYKGQYTHTNEYGNSTGQGIANKLVSGELIVYRMLKPSWRLAAFTSLNLSVHRTAGINHWQPVFQAGINTLLYE